MDNLKKLFTKKKEDATDAIIENIQKEQKKLQAKVFKILLLGTGESGKSTIFKQMKFMYGTNSENSVTTEVKEQAALHCFNSVISDTQTIIKALSKDERKLFTIPEDFPSLSEEGMKAADILSNLTTFSHVTASSDHAESDAKKPGHNSGFDVETGLHDNVAAAIKGIWTDPAVKKVWEEYRSKLQVSDSWGYFARTVSEKFPQWGGPKWIPTDEEFLLMRVRTTGVQECSFSVDDISRKKKGLPIDVNKKYPRILLVDVGGQKSERRKWVNAFEGMPMVLYVVASSEYDQVMFDDLSKNRLSDSLDTFQGVAHEKAFTNTSFTLFLNKSDLLRDKLCNRKVPLNSSGEFPDAPEGFDFDEAILWLTKKYQERMPKNKGGGTKNSLFVHVTTATDKENAQKVLDSLVTSVLENLVGPLIPFT